MSNTVHVLSSDPAYATDISVGKHRLRVDEPVDAGGSDSGPTPKEMLLSALGACTAITLRMYAERKQWPLENARIELSLRDTGAAAGKTVIDRQITLTGNLDEQQRERLLQIANVCPVHKLLTGTVEIPTKLVV